jgi:hypothetical protein
LSTSGVESFAQAHPGLGERVDLFQATLADSIDQVLREGDPYRQFSAFKVFTEFCGPNSFAGMHKADDPKRLVLFDVWAEPFGLIGPEQFVADFGHLPSARVVYRGKFTGQFAEDVRRGKHGVAEGVVCKGGSGGTDLWMAKIKTYAYLEKLKAAFADRWEDFWE